MTSNVLTKLTTSAIILALMVVMLGAYTRLTDAGLGCPDWPGCYGKMILPVANDGLSHAQLQYPENALVPQKAWTEMIHRYAAGTLGLLIALIFFISTVLATPKKLKATPIFLLIMVVFQAALGMWTVTLKLLPLVVMSHLLGGIIIFATLCYLRWQLSTLRPVKLVQWRSWIILGAMILLGQVALGGWVSSNYAGIACLNFPKCNNLWLPHLDFSNGFHLFSPVGSNYQGGLLEIDARITIQFIHRLGALLTAFYVLILGGLLLRRSDEPSVRGLAILVIGLIAVQLILGIINVVYFLPLWSSVAHNGVAALLVALMFSLLYLSKGDESHAL